MSGLVAAAAHGTVEVYRRDRRSHPTFLGSTTRAESGDGVLQLESVINQRFTQSMPFFQNSKEGGEPAEKSRNGVVEE